MSHSLKEQYASSPLFGGNAAAVEGLYEKYLDDPASVAGAWRDYFDTLGDAGEVDEQSIEPAFAGCVRRAMCGL